MTGPVPPGGVPQVGPVPPGAVRLVDDKAPPPGPGVRPPFVAAPVEGRRSRVGLGLALAGGLLALCCAAGGVVMVGLLVLGEQAINEQAQRTAEDYLAALSAQDWQEAYAQRCPADRAAESRASFEDRMADNPRITEYQVGELRIEPGDGAFDAGELSVPAEVRYADGTGTQLQIPLEQNAQTGQLEVCGRLRAG